METKENTGALFSNANKKTDNHPDYTGSAKVNGEMMSISAWINTAKSSGKQYMRLKFDEYKPVDKKVQQGAYTYESSSTSASENEIPF